MIYTFKDTRGSIYYALLIQEVIFEMNEEHYSEVHANPDSGKPRHFTSKSKIGIILVGILILFGAVYWYAFGGNVALTGAKKDGTGLFPFICMGSWGYMDSSGKIMIEPQFESLVAVSPYFSEGLAPVKVGEKWGYIDQNGKIVIRPQFENAWLFKDGLAAVEVRFPANNGESGSYTTKTGYIDKTGKIVVRPQFSDRWIFGGSQSPIRIGDIDATLDRWSNYDTHISYSQPNNFSNGLLAVEIDGQWGYMGKDGKMIIKPQFQKAKAFSEGIATVKLENKWVYIDTTGKQVINQQYDMADSFTEGLAVFGKGEELDDGFDWVDNLYDEFNKDPDKVFWNKKWGYIQADGKLLTTAQFNGAKPFSEGLAAVRVGKSWGYLDKAGKIAITPKYQRCLSFSEGLAPVCVKNKWGYVDKKGNEVIKIQFDQAGEFVQGLAQVLKNDRRGYIDTHGVVIRWDERAYF